VIAVQLFDRVPWLFVLADEDETQWPRGLRRAAAVLVPDNLCTVGNARRASLSDPGTVRDLLCDVALAEDARAGDRPGPGAVVSDAWMFLNDRATRLSMLLLQRIRTSPHRIHPHDLLETPWHEWFDRQLRRSDRVLDLGCADGSHTLRIARRAGSVVGGDIDSSQLRAATERAERAGIPNVTFVECDLGQPDVLVALGADSFDVVTALDVLEHLARRGEVLRGVRDLLVADGKLILSVPNRDTPYKRWRRRLGGFAYADADHKIEYNDDSLGRELGAAGFSVVSLERGGYDTPFAGFARLLAPLSVPLYRRLMAHWHCLSLRHPGRATALRVVARPAQARRSATS
jgi:SAM-dependent methyltransferase